MISSQLPDDISIISEIVALAEKNPEIRISHLQNFASTYQFRFMYRFFRKYVSRGAGVLDWGVGNGHFSYFLMRSGYNVCGFSFENFPAEVGLSDTHYRFVRGNAMDPVRLPFKDCSFAAVASVGVLEHVKETGGDEVASLGEIARILKPDGVFVCCHLPNRYSLIEALARCFPNKHYHKFRYTGSDIAALVKQSKLQLVETKRYGFLPRNIWQYAPKRLRHTRIFALAWDILDALLAFPFTLLCRNYIFVARKPGKAD